MGVVGKEERGGGEAGIIRALVGLERAPLATIRKLKGSYQLALRRLSGVEARPLTSTRTHGQVCPPVQSTKESMFFEPGW